MNLIVNWSLTGNALSAIVFYGISKKNCKKVKNRSICLNLITSTQFLLEKALDCLEVFQLIARVNNIYREESILLSNGSVETCSVKL